MSQQGSTGNRTPPQVEGVERKSPTPTSEQPHEEVKKGGSRPTSVASQPTEEAAPPTGAAESASNPTPTQGVMPPPAVGSGVNASRQKGASGLGGSKEQGAEKKKWAGLQSGREKVYPVFERQKLNPNLVPKAMRVHPRGFRVLSKGSPIERAMTTYFRLPPRAPHRIQEEQQALEGTVNKMVAQEQRAKKVLLNGFMLLDASGAKQPSAAKECVINNSGIVGAIASDLSFFTNLSFLDVGENQLKLVHLAPLAALEELHLHCNGITEFDLSEFDNSAGEESQGLNFLPRLHTLNLAFNAVKPNSILQLSVLESLERLDLSCNGLKGLPDGMDSLVNVRQLSLENNKLVDPNVFVALASMPNLVELNLNNNKLSCVPRVPEGGLAQLETLGLAQNKVEYFEDLYPLTQIPALKCIVLYENPIERRKKDKEILFYEFGNLQIQIVMTPPVPQKRKVGAFYAANVSSFVKVKDFKKIIKPKKKKVGGAQDLPTAGEVKEEGGDGSTFFMTQANAAGGPSATTGGGQAGGEDHLSDVGGVDSQAQQYADPNGRAPVTSSWIGDWSEVPAEDGFDAAQQGGGARFGARGYSSEGARVGSRSSQSPMDPPAQASYGRGGLGSGNIQDESGIDFAGGDYDGAFLPDINEPRGNLRSTMTELKRMLRQPLPPLSLSTMGGKTRKKF